MLISEFISRCQNIHGDTYDYSKSVYVSYSTKVSVICKIHGTFDVTPGNHISRKSGCPKCACIGRPQNTAQTVHEFIKKANKIHSKKYNYSQINYINVHTPVTIICPIHGEFQQRPVTHTSQKCGCPHCTNSSSSEIIVWEYLKNKNLKFIEQQTFNECRNPKTGNLLKFDFHIPANNLLIEVDGLHHFRPVRFNGISMDRAVQLFQEGLKRDDIKTTFAKSMSISLIRVSGSRQKILNQLDICCTER